MAEEFPVENVEESQLQQAEEVESQINEPFSGYGGYGGYSGSGSLVINGHDISFNKEKREKGYYTPKIFYDKYPIKCSSSTVIKVDVPKPTFRFSDYGCMWNKKSDPYFNPNPFNNFTNIEKYYLPKNSVNAMIKPPLFTGSTKIFLNNSVESIHEQWKLFSENTGLTKRENAKMASVSVGGKQSDSDYETSDDEVMSDEEDMYSEFKEIESDDEEDVKIKKTQFNKELKAYRDVREKKAERIYIKQELKELAQKKAERIEIERQRLLTEQATLKHAKVEELYTEEQRLKAERDKLPSYDAKPVVDTMPFDVSKPYKFKNNDKDLLRLNDDDINNIKSDVEHIINNTGEEDRKLITAQLIIMNIQKRQKAGTSGVYTKMLQYYIDSYKELEKRTDESLTANTDKVLDYYKKRISVIQNKQPKNDAERGELTQELVNILLDSKMLKLRQSNSNRNIQLPKYDLLKIKDIVALQSSWSNRSHALNKLYKMNDENQMERFNKYLTKKNISMQLNQKKNGINFSDIKNLKTINYPSMKATISDFLEEELLDA